MNRFLGFFLLFLFALALRVHHLDFDSLFMDEIHQVSYYKLPLAEVYKGALLQQQQPLDYWVGSIVSKFNDSDFYLRLPAAIFGALSVLLIAILASRISTYIVGMYVGILAGLMPYAIYVSQDARPYSISIFFMLAFLFCIDEFRRSDKHQLLRLTLLVLACVLFLLTRTLSPLIIVLVTGLFFCCCLIVNYFYSQLTFDNGMKKNMLIQVGLCIALIIYVPYFLRIINNDRSQDFLSQVDNVNQWFVRLDISEIVSAWIGQLEPLAVICLIAFLCSVLIVIKSRTHRTFLSVFLIFVFVFALVLQYGFFRYKTDYPFRAPYAIYIMPIALIVSSIAVREMIVFMQQNFSKYGRYVSAILMLIPLLFLIDATFDFKSRHIKSNWKGLTTLLDHSSSNNNIFFFETLADENHWNPNFYGFSRYPAKASNRALPISAIEDRRVRDGLSQLMHKPVLVFFHYRKYLLTSKSTVSLLTPSFEHVKFEWRDLDSEKVNVTRMTGFTLLELKADFQNSNQELLALIDVILTKMPKNSSSVNLHISAAYLAYSLNDIAKGKWHFSQANQYARKDQKSALQKAAQYFSLKSE